MKIKEVIVVEGKSDTTKIQLAVEADTIETNGSAINEQTLDLIEHAQQKRGVIIFTDPDYPGERIRHIVAQHVPGCKHAFIPQEKAKAKSTGKSVGIEHAAVETIQEALKQVYELGAEEKSNIDKLDLIRYKLIGDPLAKKRRQLLGKKLHIGYTNGKQLLQRLHMFHIQKEELKKAMEEIEK